MGFTFQALGALAPLAGPALGVDYVAMGGLIGLYWLPGAALALPTGLFAGRFGAKRLSLLGLVLLALGSVLLARSNGYALAATARLVEGCGNALLSVTISAMVADWFRGRELSTALAILFDSWAFGLSVTIAALPALAARTSWSHAIDMTALVCLAAGVLLSVTYRSPARQSQRREASRWRFGEALRHESLLPGMAAVLWTTYNAGQLVLLTYAPPMLAARGMSLATASAAVSLVGWLSMVSMPLGGVLADRSGGLAATIITGCLGAGLAGAALAFGAPALPACILAGLFIGLPAGALFSLPVRASAPAYVGWSIGWFMTVYYLLLTPAQWLAGYVRQVGSDRAAVLFGVALLVITALAVPALSAMQRARRGAAESP